MPSTRSEAETQEILKANQFSVEKIPETDRRTADFLACKNNEKYLVEVTEKEPAKVFMQMIQTANTEGFATLIREIQRNNRLEGIIREKAKQLRTTQKEADFRLLWIAGLHGDSDFLRDILARTLYGLAQLSAVRSMDFKAPPPTTHLCFYYDYFSFYRLPELDGVIFSTNQQKILFVNQFATNVSAFRNSEMYALFEEIGAVADPGTIDDPSVLFLDLGVDRADEREKWKYIKETYGILTSRMVESHFRGVVPIKTQT